MNAKILQADPENLGFTLSLVKPEVREGRTADGNRWRSRGIIDEKRKENGSLRNASMDSKGAILVILKTTLGRLSEINDCVHQIKVGGRPEEISL